MTGIGFVAFMAWAAAAAFPGGCSKPPEKVDTTRPARVMTVRAAIGDDVTLFAGDVRPRYETTCRSGSAASCSNAK